MSKASAYFTVNGADGKHNAKLLKRELDSLKGVASVSVSDKKIAVDYDTTGVNQEHILKKIENLGYQITSARFEDHTM